MRGPSPFRSALVQLDLLIFGRFLRPDIAAIGRRDPRRRLSGRRAGRRFVRSSGALRSPARRRTALCRSAGRPSARRGRARRALAWRGRAAPSPGRAARGGSGRALAGRALAGRSSGRRAGPRLGSWCVGPAGSRLICRCFGRRRVRLLAWRRLRDLPRGIGWGATLRRELRRSAAAGLRGQRFFALPFRRHATRATLCRCERIVGLAARVRVARSLLPALRSFDRAAHRHRSHRRRRARLARRRRRGPRGERRARRRLRRRRLGGNKGSPGIFWRRAVGRRLLQIDRRDRTCARAQTRGFVGSGGWEKDSRASACGGYNAHLLSTAAVPLADLAAASRRPRCREFSTARPHTSAPEAPAARPEDAAAPSSTSRGPLGGR